METIKPKRKRIKMTFTDNVEFKIRNLQKSLGMTKFETKWADICNDIKKLEQNFAI